MSHQNTRSKTSVLNEAYMHCQSLMAKEIGVPRSGLIDEEAPDRTLWNVYNIIEVLSAAISDKAEDCTDYGVLSMLEECKAAVSYEAQHVETLLDHLADKALSQKAKA